MGFAGSLQTLPLAEVLQTLNRNRATGVLKLASMNGARDIVFADGEIIGVPARMKRRADIMLSRLVLQGKIAPEIAQATGVPSEDPIVSGAILVERQLITDQDLDEALKQQATDELYDMSSWDMADFMFLEIGNPEAAAQVAACRKRPIKINSGSLLIEIARRMDEWGRLKLSFDDEDVVLAAVTGAGRDSEFRVVALQYPAAAVVSLIDSVRSIEEIIRDSVATRLDVYVVLVDLIDRGLARVLEADELRAVADSLLANGDFTRAAQTYRKVLARRADDQAAADALAECLRHASSQSGLSACVSQNALGELAKGQNDAAIATATQAVEMAPDDPAQRLVLCRCLIASAKPAEAVERLREVARLYREAGRLSDARDTVRKILVLVPDDAESKEQLTSLFSEHAPGEHNKDVLVCSACGHGNAAEESICASCMAPLHLTCTACDKAVSPCDKVCIFCGADPHAGTRRQARRHVGGPATANIMATAKVKKVVQEKGSQFWRAQLEDHLSAARAHEQAGRWAEALTEWKEVATIQTDNPDLTQHIRLLESRCHEEFIEQQIELAHRMRRGRRFYRALRAYQRALRGMSGDDPRAQKVSELALATRQSLLQMGGIYAAAFLLLSLIGLLAARPYVRLSLYQRRATHVNAELAKLGQRADLGSLPVMGAEIDQLQNDIASFSGVFASKARLSYLAVQETYTGIRFKTAEQEVADIKAALDGRDFLAANRRLDAFRRTFGADYLLNLVAPLAERSKHQEQDAKTSEADAANAPALFKEAEKAIADHPGQALERARKLAAGSNAAVQPKAKEMVARLQPELDHFEQALHDAQAQADLAKAKAGLAALAAEAKRWDRDEAVSQAEEAVAAKLRSAQTDYAALKDGADQAALESFRAAHPGTPQAAQADARLSQLRNEASDRATALTSYQALMQQGDYEKAWHAAQKLIRSYGASLPAGAVLVPLSVETVPAGATLSVDGTDVGATPTVYRYPPGKSAKLRLSLAGYENVAKDLAEVGGSWRWKANLARERRWQLALGKPVHLLAPQADGTIFAGAGDAVVAIGGDGARGWTCQARQADDLGDPAHDHLAHPPVALGGGQHAFGLIDHGVAVVDAEGKTVHTYETKQPVRGRPVVYVNDIFGNQSRLAFAGEDLCFGPVGGDIVRIQLGGSALSGPVAVPKDLDRMLVLVTWKGALKAFEESGRRDLWEVDLGANEAGQLVPTGDGGLLMVLDGGRLVCWSLNGEAKPQQRWVKKLPEPAVGDPIVLGDTVYLACGAAVLHYRLDGTTLSALKLPSPATSAVAGDDGVVAVGCRGGELFVVGAKSSWVNAFPVAVTAVGVARGLVVAGCADGTVTAFTP